LIIDILLIKAFPPELAQIDLASPANASVLSSPPSFVWTPNGGTQNVFALDLLILHPITSYWSTYGNLGQLIGETSWAPSGAMWDNVPSGSLVCWRVRGADLNQSPPAIINSSAVWWFYKP